MLTSVVEKKHGEFTKIGIDMSCEFDNIMRKYVSCHVCNIFSWGTWLDTLLCQRGIAFNERNVDDKARIVGVQRPKGGPLWLLGDTFFGAEGQLCES